MVFSATKGMASTVIHRLADRGLIDYDAPVAEYWPEFGANGKADDHRSRPLRHRAGLSQLNGVSEGRPAGSRPDGGAASPPRPISWLHGKPAYHAFTFGWLLSGLARAVTGKGMRELIRTEVAAPLNTDGLHLGRPPADAPTQRRADHRSADRACRTRCSTWSRRDRRPAVLRRRSARCTSPGIKAIVQGDIPLLDSEIPAANGVATARALARMYGAIANGGRIDGTQFLSRRLIAGLIGRPSLRLDRSMFMPLSFHLGYHGCRSPGVLPGFGHVGLGGSLGWADPATGLAFGFVHNRLLTPMVSRPGRLRRDRALIRRDAAAARKRGYRDGAGRSARRYAELPRPVAG